ncbi:hypothetical protein [Streptomyces lasalocidi]|uniref:Uncharacterized protein n=1 Tax=Streptomyces lasalocidi TaxID=324833 RepID=A0A4V6AX84_STRLS|nr:hypothetical protein [Streptomyces lasalocidi]TKT03423.1 hypothetical protein E4U91_27235 [Streptomyces lasalocidi]
MEFVLNEWLDYAKRVAESFHRTFDRVEAEDIYQELAIELVLKEKQLVAAFEMMERPESYTKTVLRNRAWGYCMKEKNAFFVQTDMYDYQPENVRIMIEQYLGGTTEGMMVPEDAKSVHGDDDLAVFADIARVVDGLSETDQQHLEAYLMDPDSKDVAARQRYSRVVRKVTDTLNRNKRKAAFEYEGTGSRKPMTNRDSLAAAKNSYNMKQKENFKERDYA